jgi:hypothetical protein
MVAPAAVGGAGEVRSLSTLLSGSDSENAIIEGAQELHRRDPALPADRITDILIAADCEGQRSSAGGTYNRAERTKLISKKVEMVMPTLPHSSV